VNELMVDSNKALELIKAELDSPRPNTKKIMKLLFDFEKDYLSSHEYFDFIGRAFKLNPDYFMKQLYESFMGKIRKIIGVEKRTEMERYILEKYCLYEDEEILYDCSGNVKQTELIEQSESGKYKMNTTPLTVSVNSGHVFLTNYRIIVNGLLKVKGGERTRGFLFYATSLWVFTGGSKRSERKEELKSSQLFGYQFPIKDHWGLGKSNFLHLVAYFIMRDKFKCTVSIKPTNQSKREADMVAIFNLLRKTPEEAINVIKQIYDFEKLEKFARRQIWGILKSIWKGEEYLGVPNSEILNIVVETFKLDPEFFENSIYPKMVAWKNESFLNIREELFDLLRREGATIN
jgi:hypothetical protein